MSRILTAILMSILTMGLLVTGCSSTTPAPRPVSEGEQSTRWLEVDLLGEKSEFLVDSQGRLKSKVELSSADGKIGLSINKGTTLLDRSGESLQLIRAAIDLSPPLPPKDTVIVGSAYNLEPQGATFKPALRLTLGYEPDKLPQGVREGELYVAYHDGSEWRKLRYKKVDTAANSVTTEVHHFTSFVILAAKEPTPSSPPAPAEGSQVGNLAPGFQFVGADGKSISLSGYRGKPVLINFWASWCSPCRFEMPFIQEIFEEWSDKGLVVLAINLGESRSTVEKFMQSNNFSMPVLLDSRGDIARKYNISPIPVTFLIDKSGIIQAKIIGAFPSKAAIEKSLGQIIP